MIVFSIIILLYSWKVGCQEEEICIRVHTHKHIYTPDFSASIVSHHCLPQLSTWKKLRAQTLDLFSISIHSLGELIHSFCFKYYLHTSGNQIYIPNLSSSLNFSFISNCFNFNKAKTDILIPTAPLVFQISGMSIWFSSCSRQKPWQSLSQSTSN